MNKREGWVESSVYHSKRVIQANNNVLQINEFTNNVSNHDE